MKLHEHTSEFKHLISVVATDMHLPESVVEQDYYMMFLLERLASSKYAPKCIFKGAASLNKIYPGTLDRFSNNLELTYVGMEEQNEICYSNIKSVKKIIAKDLRNWDIHDGFSYRGDGTVVYFDNERVKIRVRIGCNIRPERYTTKKIKSYIQEYLEKQERTDAVERYQLREISVNVLDVKYLFVEKMMLIKRHIFDKTLDKNLRHLYDVVKMYGMDEIQELINNPEEFRKLIRASKEVDSFSHGKPFETDDYDFNSWKIRFTINHVEEYENLHTKLLNTNKKLDFYEAENVLFELNRSQEDFKDKLKVALQSVIEEEERRKREANRKKAEIESELIKIKESLIKNATKGNFVTRDGFLTVECNFRNDFVEKVLRRKTELVKSTGEGRAFETHTTFDINPEYEEEFSQYISTLSELAIKDDIKISCVLCKERTDEEYPFPTTFSKERSGYGMYLCIKASAELQSN